MHSYIKVLALAALSVGIYSCAQEQTLEPRTVEDSIIKAYVEQNNIKITPTSSGLYINTLKEGTGVKPTITDWVMVKFTGKTLQGDYFHTTDTTVFNYLDYNVNYYHIVPDLLFMAGAMPQGFREALLTMKEGGKVDLLLPSYLGFGSYGAIKFGQMPILSGAYVQASRPVKYELELVKVIPKPAEYDSLQVDKFVKLPANSQYVKVKDNVFMKIITPGSTVKDDTIGNTSKAYVHYAGYFLDGYCFDTNIKTISDLFAPYAPYGGVSSTSTTGDTLAVNISANTREVVEGFDLVLRKLTKGAVAEVVFTSKFGYSTSGQSSSSGKPSIAPYTPLKFYIKVDRVVNPKSTTTPVAILPPKLLRKN